MLRRLGATVALMSLVACGPGTSAPSATPTATSPSGTTAATPTPAPVTLSAALVTNILVAPVYVGVTKGIFLKHGIDLKVVQVASGSQIVAAVQGGSAQFGGTTWAAMVPAVVQGVPLKVFGLVTGKKDQVNYDAHLAIVVRAGVDVTSVTDLRGKVIGTTLGGGQDSWLRARLRDAGVEDDEVTFANVASADMLAAMQSGAVEAVGVTEPYTSLILDQVPGSKLVVRDGGFAEARIVLVAMDPWLAGNKDVVDRLLAGYYESAQFTRQHPEESALAVSTYLPGLDPKVISDSLTHLDFDPRWSSQVQQSFDNASQILLDTGKIETKPTTTDLVASDAFSEQSKYQEFFSDLE